VHALQHFVATRETEEKARMIRRALVRVMVSTFAVTVILSMATTPRLGAQTPTLDSLSQRIDALTVQVTQLKNDLSSLNASLTTQVNTLKTQLDSLTVQLTATKSKLDQVKATVNVNVANIEILQAQVAILEASVANVALSTLAGKPCDPSYPVLGTFKVSLRLGFPLAMLCQPGSGRYIDAGLAITDTVTGLMWEKKVLGRGCLHCVEDDYTWSGASQWLERLNGDLVADTFTEGPFLGYTDWRLPTLSELQSILDSNGPYEAFAPHINPIFGPTLGSWYWSRTKQLNNNPYNYRYAVDFGTVQWVQSQLTYEHPVRAVRKAW
jgi:cell division protein FtsB